MKRPTANAGFTLVEIAVSLLVIGIGFTALLSVFTVGLKWAQDVRMQTTVSLAAQGVTDMLPAASLPTDFAPNYPPDNNVPVAAGYFPKGVGGAGDPIPVSIRLYRTAADRTANTNLVAEITTNNYQ